MNEFFFILLLFTIHQPVAERDGQKKRIIKTE